MSREFFGVHFSWHKCRRFRRINGWGRTGARAGVGLSFFRAVFGNVTRLLASEAESFFHEFISFFRGHRIEGRVDDVYIHSVWVFSGLEVEFPSLLGFSLLIFASGLSQCLHHFLVIVAESGHPFVPFF